MESFKTQKPNLMFSLLIILFSHIIFVEAVTPAGSIERATKQQILASIPASHESTPTGSSQLFLTSPSGKYTAFLLRRETSPGAGGFGTDFCYVQVQAAGVSVWESECTVISNVNTCTLVFSDAGLEIFDGSQSAWGTDVDVDNGQHLETLVLVDSGDMQIRDKEGEMVWKASDNPIVNQNCGSIGAPGLSPAHPPFGQPLHGGKGPFGQPIQNQGQGQQTPLAGAPFGQPLNNQGQQTPLAGAPFGQQQEQQLENPDEGAGQPVSDSDQSGGLSSLNQPFGTSRQGQQPLSQGQQPLIDNTPFDSGSLKEEHFMVEFAMVCLMGCFGYLFL